MNKQECKRIVKEAESFEADLIDSEKMILEDLSSFIDHALTKEYIE